MNAFADDVGVTDLSSDDGSAQAVLRADDRHLNANGTVHGGVLATLVDATMGAAVRTTTGESETPATSQLSIAYLRPGKPGLLNGSAKVIKQGESLLVVEADVEQDGKPLIHAVATFAIVTH
jgi:uncharacterized protein (TIGR00369 family)